MIIILRRYTKVENLVSVKPQLSDAQYTDSLRKLYRKYTEEHADKAGT